MGPDWDIHLDYEPETLVTDVVCTNAALAIQLECADCVDFHENVFLRRITVTNQASRRHGSPRGSGQPLSGDRLWVRFSLFKRRQTCAGSQHYS